MKDSITNIQNRIQDITTQLSNLPDLSQLENEIRDTRSRINGVNTDIGNISSNIISIGKEITALEDKLRRIASENEENRSLELRINYMDVIGSKASAEYARQSRRNREVLKETINEVFDSMFRTKGQRRVEVDNKYNVTIPLNDSVNLVTSEGTDVVKNFAFIATLLKMVKDSSMDESTGSVAEPVPVVMDAPFSKLDDVHIRNISGTIPRLSQQSIVTMTQMHWNNAQKTADFAVGKKYRLVAHSQTHTEIKECE